MEARSYTTTKLIMARVYLLSNGESYKIGVASRLAQRLKNLSTGSDSPIEVIALSKDMSKDSAHFFEKSIHKNCRQYRKKGEWYSLPPSLVDVIKHELMWSR